MITWFGQTKLKRLRPDLAEIEVPNKFFATWLHDNFAGHIQNAIKKQLDLSPEIRFSYHKPNLNRLTAELNRKGKPKKSTLPDLNPSYTFETYIVSKNNRFAFSSALAVAENPAIQYNPLFIFSKHRSGKSHLLHAIGNHFLKTKPSSHIGYISIDRFTNEISLSRKNQTPETLKKKYYAFDLLLIDNVHLLAGRKKIQEEIQHIFDYFFKSKRQMVIGSKLLPNKIQPLLPPLRSRFEWGIISEIKPYDQDTKMKIIHTMANQLHLKLPEDAVFFLANTTNDFKSIYESLVSLKTHASLYQREIDMSIVKLFFQNKEPSVVSPDAIKNIISNYFDIPIADLLSNKKARYVSYPRQIGMYLCRKMTNLSLGELGKAFGNKDHSTVIYAIKRIEKEKKRKQTVHNDIDRLQSILSE